MLNPIIVELRHCIDTIEYKLVFFSLLLFNLLSYVICAHDKVGISYQFIRSSNESFILQDNTSSYIPYLLMLLLPIYASAISALSLCKEKQLNSSILLASRIGKRKYLINKILVTVLLTFFTITIPLLINLILCHMTFPLIGYDSAWAEPAYAIGTVSYNADWYQDFMRIQHPTLYNLIYILNHGILGVEIALVAYLLNFCDRFNNLFFAKIPGLIWIIYIAWYLLCAILGFGQLTIQNYLLPNMPGNIISEAVLIIALFAVSVVLITKSINKYEIM